MTTDRTTDAKVTNQDEYAVVTGPTAIRIERLLPGPIERVWSYLTDSNKRATWLAAGEMDLRVGGRVEHIFRDNNLTKEDDPPPEKYADIGEESRITGHILTVDPPRLLHYVWAEGTEEESEVKFELTPVGENVHLVLTHSLLAKRALIVGVSAGWHVHLDILADRLRGREPDGFWRSFNRLEGEYDLRIEI